MRWRACWLVGVIKVLLLELVPAQFVSYFSASAQQELQFQAVSNVSQQKLQFSSK
jgi:hypothetical protein